MHPSDPTDIFINEIKIIQVVKNQQDREKKIPQDNVGYKLLVTDTTCFVYKQIDVLVLGGGLDLIPFFSLDSLQPT